jgi:single-strand DNA-binding protein
MQQYGFMGRLTHDVELRYTPSGKAVCDFSVAVADGKDETLFLNVTAWDKVAEHINQYFKKGKPILVKNARLKNETWEDDDGNKRSKIKVVLNEFPFFTLNNKDQDVEDGSGNEPTPTKSAKPAKAKPARAKAAAKVPEYDSDDDDDSEIPF